MFDPRGQREQRELVVSLAALAALRLLGKKNYRTKLPFLRGSSSEGYENTAFTVKLSHIITFQILNQ